MSNTIGSPHFLGIMVKPGESHAGVPLESTFTRDPAIPPLPANCAPPITPLNPFNVHDDFISCNISSFHDAQAIRHDVDSLFNVLSDIVISTSTDSLDLQQVTIDLGQNKVPQVALQPAYSLLKEIACQMTCHPFDPSNAHKSVVGVLQKLRSYAWDAKAVIALSAFALNYGKPLRLTVAQEASQKENALELHVFTLAKEEKKPAQSGSNLTSNLVKLTLELIKGIITLEKLFANKSYTLKHFPIFCKHNCAVYAYWAIFSLFACADQTEREEIQSLVLQKLNVILDQLEEIKMQQGEWQDLIWRTEVLRNPSSVGIWQLLIALIYPKNVEPDNIIANNATKELLTLNELRRTENLFLFISGLDIKLEIITSLTSIHEYKKGKIVWVPVVEDWTLETNKERFEYLKSTMPSWYVVEYFSLIKGYEPLQREWNYRGKPIVVVFDAYGKILNQNALHPITLWGIQAFPFDDATISTIVSQPWNCFWAAAFHIYPHIQTWFTASQENYFFFYGGTSKWTEEFHKHLVRIKKELEGTNTYIEHFNLAKTDQNLQTNFWHSITDSLLSFTQNVETNLNNIQMLLSMKTLDGWAIVSKGKDVFLTGYNEVMMNVLENFQNWQTNISGLGFITAISNYYFQLGKQAVRPCMKFRLDNIPSGGLIAYTCPEPTCFRKMDIKSVTFKCCHGNIHF